MIRPIGFLDTANLSATFTVKYKERLKDNRIELRDLEDPLSDLVIDRPIMREWKAARALLARIKASAAQQFDGQSVDLGKAWLELLPGGAGTPWAAEEDDYAQSVVRTRTCLLPAPDAYTCSGAERIILNVGWLHVIEHRLLCSEFNLGTHPRLHLVVDVKKPEIAGD